MLCRMTLDRFYMKLCRKNKGVGQPEFRLPLAVGGSLLLPISIALYGWIAQLRLPSPLLLLSVGALGISISLSNLPVLAYIVDAFGLYSASAIASVIVARCFVGALLPLAIWPLIGSLGYGWAFTILSAICLGMTPVPILVMWNGPKWRQCSRYSKSS